MSNVETRFSPSCLEAEPAEPQKSRGSARPTACAATFAESCISLTGACELTSWIARWKPPAPATADERQPAPPA